MRALVRGRKRTLGNISGAQIARGVWVVGYTAPAKWQGALLKSEMWPESGPAAQLPTGCMVVYDGEIFS